MLNTSWNSLVISSDLITDANISSCTPATAGLKSQTEK